MTLSEIADFVASVDENAMRYESTDHSGNYTVWREYRRLSNLADNRHVEGWAFQIDRFTLVEDDEIADALFAALDADVRISFSHQVDYERETRYIHHIFDCEVV